MLEASLHDRYGGNMSRILRYSWIFGVSLVLLLPSLAAAQVPEFSSPAPGSILSGSTEEFTWSANGSGADQWWLYVGTIAGGADVYDSGNLGGLTAISVSGIPTDTSTIYARLWYRASGGGWQFIDASYTATLQVSLLTPAANSTLSGSSQAFTWTANGAPIDGWWLHVGTTLGASNEFYDSGFIASDLSVTATGIPTNGSTLNVRLWYRIGGNWQYTDTAFRAASIGSTPAITSPGAESTLTGASQTFQWSADGSVVDEWWLHIGSSYGGTDYLDSGSTALLSRTVNELPTDGRTLYVRLWFRAAGADWQHTDTTYAAATVAPPSIVTPAAGTPLGTDEITFTWTAHEAGVDQWWLEVGTSAGDASIYSSGNLGSGLTATVTGIPTDGTAVFVRLWYRAIGHTWLYVDTIYQSPLDVDIQPAPYANLSGSSELFSWTPANDVVEDWVLEAGSFPGGTNIFSSGHLGDTFSVTVTGLPTNGSTVYVRLWYRISGLWQYHDQVYLAASTDPAPGITDPAPGTTLSGDSATFTWTADGTTVDEWWLYVGSSLGGSDVYDSNSLGTNLSATVNGLPLDGRTLYVRLWFRASGGGWQYADVLYTAAGG